MPENTNIQIWDTIPFSEELPFVFLVTKNTAYVEYQNSKLVRTSATPDLVGYNAIKIFTFKEDAIKFVADNEAAKLTEYAVVQTTYSIHRVNIETSKKATIKIQKIKARLNKG